jgi:hypothetical protein
MARVARMNGPRRRGIHPPAHAWRRAGRIGKTEGQPSVREAPIYRRASSPTNEVLRVLRKEVIQPQVPLRLPCYDLAPITSLTFGSVLHKWLDNRLRVLPVLVA